MDLTCNGKCTECGECCGYILPITNQEIVDIKRYIKTHNISPMPKKIFKAGMAIPLQNMNCPFLDYKKQQHKCKIYPVRPNICKVYKCNQDATDVIDSLDIKALKARNLWETFGFIKKEDPVAMCTLYNALTTKNSKK